MNSFAVSFGDPVLRRTLTQTASRLQLELAKTIPLGFISASNQNAKRKNMF